jgi:hypothetical protein
MQYHVGHLELYGVTRDLQGGARRNVNVHIDVRRRAQHLRNTQGARACWGAMILNGFGLFTYILIDTG